MKRCFCVNIILISVLLFTSLSVFAFQAGIKGHYPPYYGTIQEAVNAASSGDTIMVTTGITYEVIGITNKNLEIVGGYLENLVDSTDIKTVVDGGSSGSVFTFINSTCIVENISMRNGYNFNTGGGGAIVFNSKVTLDSSGVYSNSGNNGGGIYLDSLSLVVLTNKTEVYKNHGWWGGGCFIVGDMIISDSIVNSNIADEAGGGIYAHTGSNLKINNNSKITGNSATNLTYGGGGIYIHAADVSISGGSRISKNTTTGAGGGAYSDSSTLRLFGSTSPEFCQNQSHLMGGGIFITNTTLELESAYFITNETEIAWGGGISAINSTINMPDNSYSGVHLSGNNGFYAGGGIYMHNTTATLQNVYCGIPTGNKVGLSGAGIYAEDSDLIIRGGCFDGNIITNGWDNRGAGLAVFNSSLTVTNITGVFARNISFTGNMAYSNGMGGAIYIEDNGTHPVHLYEVEIFNNYAEKGGGIYTTNMTLYIYNMTAISNHADYGGGVLWASEGSIHFYNGSLCNNCADGSSSNFYISGGAVFSTNTDITINNTTFSNNVSTHNGGGMAMIKGSLAIDRAAFISNVASNGDGGGIWGYFLSSCTITHNTAPYYSATNREPLIFKENLAGWNGGAIDLEYCATSRIDYAQFVSNTAQIAGAIHASSTPVETRHSLYADNIGKFHTGGPFVACGGIFTAYTNFIMGFCTMINNNPGGIYASYSTGNIYSSILWGGEYQLTNESGTVALSNSCIENGYIGTDNFTNNPGLMSDYHLRYDSPCITRNTSGSPYTDIDREQRSYSVGWDQFVDSDNDLLPDYVENGSGVWSNEYQTGTSKNTPDTDGDGMPDGKEWIADVDPNDPASIFRITKMWWSTNTANSLWIRQVGGTSAYVNISMTPDLNSNKWKIVALAFPPTLRTNDFQIAVPTNTIQYFRCHAAQ